MKMPVHSDHQYDSGNQKKDLEVSVTPSHFDVVKGLAGVAIHFTTTTTFRVGSRTDTETSTESKIFKVADARKIGEALIKQADMIKAEFEGGKNSAFTEI